MFGRGGWLTLSHSTTDEPHKCVLTAKDHQGNVVPCPFSCQSSSLLTRHKKEVHNYNPKTDRQEGSTRTGKLQAYERFIRPPKAHTSSAAPEPSSSSSTLVAEPPMLSFPIPPSLSMVPYPPFDAVYQGSLAQLPRVHPGDYRRLPKQEPLDVGVLSTSYMPHPNAGAWAAPYNVPTQPILTHTGEQWTPYPVPPYGYSTQHW